MQLVFTKGRGKYDRMDVVRVGRSDESVECPKQGIIPHDMVHYAVESVLRKRGFIGRVADGESASLRMTPQAESDGVERLVEVFQASATQNATRADSFPYIRALSAHLRPMHINAT